jgi:hypothetical protein
MSWREQAAALALGALAVLWAWVMGVVALGVNWERVIP